MHHIVFIVEEVGLNNKPETMIPPSQNLTTLDSPLLIVLKGPHKRSWIAMNSHPVESRLFMSLCYVWRPVITQNLIFNFLWYNLWMSFNGPHNLMVTALGHSVTWP